MVNSIGIDPGPTYTAISVIDEDENVLLSTTYKCPEGMNPITWAVHVTNLILTDVIPLHPDALIGIEGVAPPQAYNNGKKSLMNPKYLIWLGMVVGSLANALPHAVVVRPGKNGSGKEYPPELTGTRPKTLPGNKVGTRNHERSAYDVAKQVKRLHREGYTLDTKKGVFDE